MHLVIVPCHVFTTTFCIDLRRKILRQLIYHRFSGRKELFTAVRNPAPPNQSELSHILFAGLAEIWILIPEKKTRVFDCCDLLYPMETNPNQSPNNNAASLLLPEIGPDGLARESPAIAYTEKIIEEEKLQLRKYIEENYSKIRDVERELSNLSMEMKLTAGPKKAALEHLRKKIEISTEKIRVAKLKEEQAKQAWEAAAKSVQEEEAFKQKLCEDLNNLVQESSSSQLSRLEELKRRLEALNPSRTSVYSPSDANQRPALASVIQDSSAVPSTSGPNGATATIMTESNAANSAISGQNQQPSSDGEGRGKKKNSGQGRVRGIGAVPKGRGPAPPGWTGAGFDVDSRG